MRYQLPSSYLLNYQITRLPNFLHSVLLLFALVRLFQIATCFIQRALRVVAGLDGLAIFVDRTGTLSGDIKDLAELDMAPDFGPARVLVAVERFTVFVSRGLVILLKVEHFGNAVVRQRAVVIHFQRLVEFGERFRQAAFRGQLLAPADGLTDFQVG